MRYALNAAQMKAADRNTIEHFGVASLVLQERAALAVCDRADAYFQDKQSGAGRQKTIRIFAGPGNNGADAIACARILSQRGFQTDTVLVGDAGKQTGECRRQLQSVQAYGLFVRAFSPREKDPETVPDLVIDGLLGVGINRAPEGAFHDAIEEINRLHENGAYVLSVDIPSGIGTDEGSVAGAAVFADETVTFGFAKCGQLLYPASARCGKLQVADIGITRESLLAGTENEIRPDAFYFRDGADVSLPPRRADGNKGTFGKVLVVAGSKETGGAVILAAKAALLSGCGMVRVFTERTNRDAVLQALPEALIDCYDAGAFDAEAVLPLLDGALLWADAVVCGCGIGTGETAVILLKHLLENGHLPLVLDADALNLLALPEHALMDPACRYGEKAEPVPLVLTPHAGEFARLYNRVFAKERTVADCKAHAAAYTRALAKKMNGIVLFKDARSIACCGDAPYYINLSGNDGMATAGSGDVLAGLLGSLLAQTRGRNAMETVCAGAFFHGLSGDYAAERCGKRALCASDIADALAAVLRDFDGHTDTGGFVA